MYPCVQWPQTWLHASCVTCTKAGAPQVQCCIRRNSTANETNVGAILMFTWVSRIPFMEIKCLTHRSTYWNSFSCLPHCLYACQLPLWTYSPCWKLSCLFPSPLSSSILYPVDQLSLFNLFLFSLHCPDSLRQRRVKELTQPEKNPSFFFLPIQCWFSVLLTVSQPGWEQSWQNQKSSPRAREKEKTVGKTKLFSEKSKQGWNTPINTSYLSHWWSMLFLGDLTEFRLFPCIQILISVFPFRRIEWWCYRWCWWLLSSSPC